MRQAALRRPRLLFAPSAAGQARGPWIHYDTSPDPGRAPSWCSVVWDVAELSWKNKGLLSIPLSRVGDMKKPSIVSVFFVNSPPPSINTSSAVHMFSTSAGKVAPTAVAVAAADIISNTYTCVGCRICSTEPSAAGCRNTEHVHDHDGPVYLGGNF